MYLCIYLQFLSGGGRADFWLGRQQASTVPRSRAQPRFFFHCTDGFPFPPTCSRRSSFPGQPLLEPCYCLPSVLLSSRPLALLRVAAGKEEEEEGAEAGQIPAPATRCVCFFPWSFCQRN